MRFKVSQRGLFSVNKVMDHNIDNAIMTFCWNQQDSILYWVIPCEEVRWNIMCDKNVVHTRSLFFHQEKEKHFLTWDYNGKKEQQEKTSIVMELHTDRKKKKKNKRVQ